MDRILIAEFPWFSVTSDNADPANWILQATDTRSIGTTGQVYVQEMKLDLSGYVQDSLTVGFRRSFEQEGATDRIFWKKAFDPNNDGVQTQTIVSSVPFNDEQLTASILTSPGFIPYPVSGIDYGNFNRTHIIHGRYQEMFPNTIIGSGGFGSTGNAALTSIADHYYSSLEPTAADCLYCYRVFLVPAPSIQGTGISTVSLPPKRVILDAFTVEEPDLEYMMRLKRSYELANQV